MVVVDEIDRTEGAVLKDAACHAADAVAVVGVVLHGETDAVAASSK